LEKFSYDDIENYIVDRELGFCEIDLDKEEVIKNSDEYIKLLNIHMMITDCSKDNKFIFKGVFDSDEEIIEKNIINFQFISSRMFFKVAGVAAILVILFLPLKLFLEKQINMINQNERVSINPKDFFNNTENNVVVLNETIPESMEKSSKEDKIMVASVDKVELKEVKPVETLSESMEKSSKEDKIMVSSVDKVELKEVKPVETLSESMEKSSKEDKIMVSSVDKVELKEVKPVETLSESMEKSLKEDKIMVASVDKVEEKQISVNENIVNNARTVTSSSNLRGKKIIDYTKTSLNSKEVNILNVENVSKLKLESKYLKVKGIENNKIYTKVKITFETLDGYNYKYYINNKDYKEGTEYREIGTHKFTGKIYKDNQLIDEVEIIFDIR